jgi:poly(3-hydroxyoctanoate) depolymerase
VTEVRGDWRGDLRIRGHTLHVSISGSGPPVLLINGLGGSLGMLSDLRDDLEGHRVIIFDAPGTGKSPAPWHIYGIDWVAGLALDLLSEVGCDEVDVVGYSLGGAAAQEIARQAPERVRRLVLVASGCGWGMVPGRISSAAVAVLPVRYYSKTLYKLTTRLVAGGAEATSGFLERTIADRFSSRPSMRGYALQLGAAWLWTSLPWLHEIAAPTLVLAGAEDTLVPSANSEILASRIPNARLVLVDGWGHLLLYDGTSGAGRLIADFLGAADLDASDTWTNARLVTHEEACAATDRVRRVEPASAILRAFRNLHSPPAAE